MSNRDRRVNLALKWHYLDNLSPKEVRDRFEAEGIADLTVSTIRDYLNEDPEEEVLEMIEAEHADVRLQAAERFERLYQQAREDHDELAVEDEPVRRVKPEMRRLPADSEPIEVPAWEVIDPGDEDWPEHANERDLYIRFTDGTRAIKPGDQYPARNPIDDEPVYTTEMVGMARDVPELSQRQASRGEMSQHMQAKADVMGVYSTDINLDVDGELETSVSLDEEAAAVIREATSPTGDSDE
ncbi:hypothetical protein [Halobacterium sp. CBA1126]|uniref:hypothetical protein n=1 Tax=Halobacterium sp. CBA1126 TaxID=2668074 RepID=UPI0018D2258A|nr:hypothetical protein [Halobacterium sp. CBA1126]